MGHSRCAAPGCFNTVSKGLIFKVFPRDPVVAQKWVDQLPSGFKVSAHTAVCEVHFDSSQFEKPRADGRRKLKHSAVPFFEKIKRNSLGDLRNLNAENAVPGKESPPNPPACCSSKRNPLGDISNVYVVQCSSAKENKHYASTSVKSIYTEHNYFKTSKGTVDGCISPAKEAVTSNAVIFNQGQASPSVDEGLGHKHISSVEESPMICDTVECDQQNIIPAEDEKSKSREDELMTIIAQQRAEIARLKKEEEEKDRRIDAHLKSAKRTLAMRRKFLALKKMAARLESSANNKSYSPWLTKSQQRLLRRKCTRGIKWDPELIREGLILKMRCGTSGYSAFVQRLPLFPSVRSLQEAVQFMNFESGILNEMFDLLEVMAKSSTDMEKDCTIVLDEMELEEGERYDVSSKKFVGKATLPSHDGLASKGLVFVLAGISRRWKTAVAVYLANKRSQEALLKKKENLTGQAYKNILDSIIVKAEGIGLRVCNVTSDMGPDNLTFWKAYGVTGSKFGPVKSSFLNPKREGCEVFIMPDPVHLFKNIKSMLENNGTVTLPEDIVQEEGLPSSLVDYRHIDDLYEYEDNFELKIAFRLSPDKIHCSKHFSKMNVATHRAVICHRTGVALNQLAVAKQNPAYETTAWFVMQLNTFFDLVTCRSKHLAISLANLEVYEKALSLIRKMDYMFATMKVGNQGLWKPAQRGMRVLCNSLIGLIEYFLKKRGYKYLLLGRFLQDCLENLFSAVRLRQPIPHCVAFFQCLKVITLAQYATAIKGSSYDHEEVEFVTGVDFLEEARKRAKERATQRFYDSLTELLSIHVRKVTDKELAMVPTWEQCVIYDMAGGVIAGLLATNNSLCDQCVSATKWKSNELHPRSVITEAKEYTLLRPDDCSANPLQVYVSDEVFKVLLSAEVTFRLYRYKTLNFRDTDVERFFVDNLMYLWTGTTIPQCHKITEKILTFFIKGRLQEFGKILRAQDQQKNKSTQSLKKLASKSTAMRESAAKISGTTVKST